MALSTAELSGGLGLDKENFFPTRPEDPQMRESTSIWLYEENGAFGFPRIGIEGEAWSWDNRLYHANFNMGGGRVLHDMGRGPVPSPIDAKGVPSIFGAGPLTFRCLEPFRRWSVVFDGTAADGTLSQMIGKTLDQNKRTPVRFEVELTMVTPGWVQDYTPEKVAQLSKAEIADAAAMGFGWRIEHLFRAKGQLHLDGKTRTFNAVGSRVKRQSVRTMTTFRGHCWQSAVFPDGRAFGYISYPVTAANPEPYAIGYVYANGRMYPAQAVKVPWLRRIVEDGEDVSLELKCELGTVKIAGSTALATFRVGNEEMGGYNLQQSGARYTWDGQSAYGMIERSSTDAQMAEFNKR
jgi:hypothetical protein